jgi:L-ascorbate metabolism protein UlaG (beta-lactamase superfamily)
LGVAADCLGFIIHGGAKIYFPGDTRLFPAMADLAGDLDVALLPVWGWGPARGRMHMGPKEAAESLNLLRPRIAIPIHWGTYLPFWLSWAKPGFHYYPPLEFAARAKKDAPQVKVHILLPGESLQV